MSNFQKAASISELSPGQMKNVKVSGTEVLLANVDGEVHAVSDICTHAEVNLSDGELNGASVECPLHGACFSVKTGKVEADPADTDLACYEVKVEGDDILVAI